MLIFAQAYDSVHASCNVMRATAAGVEVSLTNLADGLKFSWPIYKSGLSVLIASHVDEGDYFTWAEAFDWNVWLALGGTAVAVGLLVTLAEFITHRNKANKKGLQVCEICALLQETHVWLYIK